MCGETIKKLINFSLVSVSFGGAAQVRYRATMGPGLGVRVRGRPFVLCCTRLSLYLVCPWGGTSPPLSPLLRPCHGGGTTHHAPGMPDGLPRAHCPADPLSTLCPWRARPIVGPPLLVVASPSIQPPLPPLADRETGAEWGSQRPRSASEGEGVAGEARDKGAMVQPQPPLPPELASKSLQGPPESSR